MEQTLFRGQVMKMCGTVPNMAQKSVLGAIWRLRNFLSPRTDFQFQVSMFGALYLPNKAEPALDPICKVVVLT